MKDALPIYKDYTLQCNSSSSPVPSGDDAAFHWYYTQRHLQMDWWGTAVHIKWNYRYALSNNCMLIKREMKDSLQVYKDYILQWTSSQNHNSLWFRSLSSLIFTQRSKHRELDSCCWLILNEIIEMSWIITVHLIIKYEF